MSKKKQKGGDLKAPDGTVFIKCGECENPRFYYLAIDPKLNNGAVLPAAVVCTMCGNTIEIIQKNEGQDEASGTT